MRFERTATRRPSVSAGFHEICTPSEKCLETERRLFTFIYVQRNESKTLWPRIGEDHGPSQYPYVRDFGVRSPLGGRHQPLAPRERGVAGEANNHIRPLADVRRRHQRRLGLANP